MIPLAIISLLLPITLANPIPILQHKTLIPVHPAHQNLQRQTSPSTSYLTKRTSEAPNLIASTPDTAILTSPLKQRQNGIWDGPLYVLEKLAESVENFAIRSVRRTAKRTEHNNPHTFLGPFIHAPSPQKRDGDGDDDGGGSTPLEDIEKSILQILGDPGPPEVPLPPVKRRRREKQDEGESPADSLWDRSVNTIKQVLSMSPKQSIERRKEIDNPNPAMVSPTAQKRSPAEENSSNDDEVNPVMEFIGTVVSGIEFLADQAPKLASKRSVERRQNLPDLGQLVHGAWDLITGNIDVPLPGPAYIPMPGSGGDD